MIINQKQAKLGIVAGGGDLPTLIIDACRAEGRPYFVLGLSDFAEPDLLPEEPGAWIRLGEVGKAFDCLKLNEVKEVVMAGRVRRPSLSQLNPDYKTTKLLARIGIQALGDDGLLAAVIEEIEGEGFCVVGVDDILSNLLAKSGPLGEFEPDKAGWMDITRGCEVVSALGGADVGQAAVIQQGIVLGVEAAEGTDALIDRCARLNLGGSGGVLVKLRKPGQDHRADLPTVGVGTVESAVAGGLSGVAVEAHGVLVIQGDAMIQKANAASMFVVGIDPTEVERITIRE